MIKNLLFISLFRPFPVKAFSKRKRRKRKQILPGTKTRQKGNGIIGGEPLGRRRLCRSLFAYWQHHRLWVQKFVFVFSFFWEQRFKSKHPYGVSQMRRRSGLNARTVMLLRLAKRLFWTPVKMKRRVRDRRGILRRRYSKWPGPQATP